MFASLEVSAKCSKAHQTSEVKDSGTSIFHYKSKAERQSTVISGKAVETARIDLTKSWVDPFLQLLPWILE